jgi:fibro-slime domain-containing protein
LKAFRNLIWPLAVAAMGLAPFAAAAGTITMSVTYYTVAETDHDMKHLAYGTFTNEVQSTLGPHHLPVLNTAAYGCISNCFTHVPFPTDLTASGEITWWSPSLNQGGSGGLSDVIQTGTADMTLPYLNTKFFPPNGTGANDTSGFQAAVFSTTLNVPSAESIAFNLGSDDDAFVYLDGRVVCELGGAHADAPAICTSSILMAGSHTLELFYADIQPPQAKLTFNVTTSGISGAPLPATPVPPSILLTVAGLVCIGLFWGYRGLRTTGRNA